MRKRTPSSSGRVNCLWRLHLKFWVSFCCLLGLLACVRLQCLDKLQPPVLLRHHLSRSSAYDSFQGTPKVAFLFLARRDLPLDFLWDAFFKGVAAVHYSVYIHAEPGFDFNKTMTRSAIFIGRQLQNSIHVGWGESSMIEAERLLLEAALQDPANQRFVLLSESCVPIYNFRAVYSYLMFSTKSFIESFIDPDDCYNPKMAPIVTKDKWRKGSQITLVRRHAEIVVDDDYVFLLFKRFCQLSPPVDLTMQGQILQAFDLMLNFQNQHLSQYFRRWPNCIPDEHYVQTLPLVHRFSRDKIYGFEDEVERRTLTYTFWNQSAARGPSRWHPITFNDTDATPQKITEIKMINLVRHESEHRSQRCRVGGRLAHCFLFARKFTQQAAMRLLREDVFA